MKEHARSIIARPWVKFLPAVLAPAVALLAVTSCDDTDRHKIMTTFFDGVPPPASETPAGAGSDPNGSDAPRSLRAGGWYVHEPLQDCTDCHGRRQHRQTFSRKVLLVAEVPQLCYQCHEEYATLEGWIHGPVATGDCLLCHEPHKTKTPALLVKPVPELCYQCHQPDAVGLIEGHGKESYAQCADCHEGHAGPTKSLLRPTFLERPEGLAYAVEFRRRRYEEALRRARSDLAGGEDLGVVLEKVINAVQSAQWWRARAYLEAVLEGDNVADTEKRRLVGALRQLVTMQEAQSGARGAVPEAPSLSDTTREALTTTLREIVDRRSKQHRDRRALLRECQPVPRRSA